MKRFGKIISGVLAAGLLVGGFVSCGSKKDDFLYQRYNYDLTQYIDLAEYKGLDALVFNTEITDDQVEMEIQAVLSYYSRFNSVEGHSAEPGNQVKVSYSAVVDGINVESEESKEIVLGVDSILFHDNLIGCKAGDTLSLDLTYPDPYEEKPDYAGKAVHYEITVLEVGVREYPMYTDDFVRGYLGYDSIAAYEEAVTEKLGKYRKDSLTEYVLSQIWPQILENTTVHQYPETEVEMIYQSEVKQNELYAAQKGLPFVDCLRLVYGMTPDEFYDAVREYAEATVKEEMICYAIARMEGITLSDEEYAERAEEYAIDLYGYNSVEEMEAEYSKDSLRRTLLMDKVKEFVVASVNGTQPDNGDIVIRN